MSESGEQSILEKLLGLNWRTTVGGCLNAGGLALAACAMASGSVKWNAVGLVCAAIGGALNGANGRDRQVTGAQMDAAKAAKDTDKVTT